MTLGCALVALPLPLAEPYRYRIPEGVADLVVAGARVLVPVRQREFIGIVVALAELPEDAARLRDILAVPDAEPALPPHLLEVARWISGYYGAPIGLVLRAMLPGPLWGESKVIATLKGKGVPGGVAGEVCNYLDRKGGSAPVATIARALKRPVWDAINRLVRVDAIELELQPPDTEGGTREERVVSLAGTLPTLSEREGIFKRAPAQRAVLEALEEHGGSASVHHLLDKLKLSRTGIAGLVKRGLVRLSAVEVHRDPFAHLPPSPPPPTPTAAQREALARIAQLGPGDGAVL
ncbi:MAG TPA: hypothetical protein VG817_08335, partial [Gemmatimonadales bacterium]|nr:hypothetical protein [Gemmatimonadales bacterium]